jgi:hypothetical protein
VQRCLLHGDVGCGFDDDYYNCAASRRRGAGRLLVRGETRTTQLRPGVAETPSHPRDGRVSLAEDEWATLSQTMTREENVDAHLAKGIHDDGFGLPPAQAIHSDMCNDAMEEEER